jgi:iron complex transport system substrate-binding protein
MWILRMNSKNIFHFMSLHLCALCCALVAGMAAAFANDLPTALSVDNCADQYLLALADREQVVAVSQDAWQEFSYHADIAKQHSRVHSSSEELIALSPDFVISSWGWPAQDRQLPEQHGIEFVQMQFGHTPEVIAENLRQIAVALDRLPVAESIILQMEQRLDRAHQRAEKIAATANLTAAYITPSGTTSGSDTLMDSIMHMAGLRNVVAEHGYTGWRYLDLEQLVSDDPDILVASFFELGSQTTDNWSISRHKVMRSFLTNKPVVYIPSRYLGCSAWYFLEAVELIQDQVESDTVAVGITVNALAVR